MLAKKHLECPGFVTLANIIDNFLTITKIFKNGGLTKTPFKRKRKNYPPIFL